VPDLNHRLVEGDATPTFLDDQQEAMAEHSFQLPFVEIARKPEHWAKDRTKPIQHELIGRRCEY
jgi:hypothetical protein